MSKSKENDIEVAVLKSNVATIMGYIGEIKDTNNDHGKMLLEIYKSLPDFRNAVSNLQNLYGVMQATQIEDGRRISALEKDKLINTGKNLIVTQLLPLGRSILGGAMGALAVLIAYIKLQVK